jgi:hypothetical protein
MVEHELQLRSCHNWLSCCIFICPCVDVRPESLWCSGCAALWSAVHELAAVAGAAGLRPVAILEVVSSPVLLALTV